MSRYGFAGFAWLNNKMEFRIKRITNGLRIIDSQGLYVKDYECTEKRED